MNKDLVLNKLKEIVEIYKEKQEIEGICLTTYLEQGTKILELNILTSSNLNFKERIEYEDIISIIVTSLTEQDLKLKETNERSLLKILNSSILYDKNNKLTNLQNTLKQVADRVSLATMENEITFFEDEEIKNKI